MIRWRRSWVSGGTAILMGLGLLLPPPLLRAEDADEDCLVRAQAARERRVNQACELIDRLDLSRFQARRLVQLAEQAAALHIEAYELEARLLPEMIEAFGEFAREDSLNQGFTRDVERRTARANHEAKAAQERITEQLVALEEQASKVLKPSQRERLNDSQRKQAPLRRQTVRTDARSRARAAERQREEARRRPLREARQELHALHQQRHARTGPIAQYLLHPYGAERLCQVARVRMPETLSEAVSVLAHGTSACPLELVEQHKAQVRQLRAEINNWNLINGLHLTGDQIEQVTDLYDQAASPMWKIVERDRRTGVPRGALFKLEREVEQVLNGGQRRVLAEYKACLIPPKNLKDPVSVGQVSDNSRYERWLERSRKMSSRELAKHIEQTLEREAEQLGERSRTERQKRVALLRTAVRQASAMSETEFELGKGELAERIAPPDRVQEIKDKIATLTREYGEPGALAQFMLNPGFMDQLRQRGRRLAGGITTERVDLAAGPQAENCDEGCAIEGKQSKGKKKRNKK